MKKLTLKIRQNTKAFIIGFSMVGGLLLAVNSRLAAIETMQHTTYAFVGIAATLKAKKEGEKSAYDALDANTKTFVDSIDAVLKGLHDGSITKDGLKTELDAFVEKHGQGLNEAQMKSFNEMVDAVKAQAIEIQKLKDAGITSAEKEVTFYGKVKAALEQHKTKLEEAADAKSASGQFRMTIKAADSLMTTGYVSSAPNSYLPMPMVVPGVKETPEVELNVMQLINMGPSSSPSVTWVNELPVEGDADYTGEGELKAQVSWKYNNETATSSKITAFVKVTTQSLRNIGFLANRINTRLRYLILNKVEDGLINGDGTDDSLTGIVSYAPGFTTTAFNGSVADPQTVDALVCMAGQVDQMLYTPNVALMNPVDIRKMKLVKDANGNYVMPPFATTNGTYVDNMRVVANRKIAVGYALVGDFSKSNGFMVEDITLDVGLDGDDFTKNRRTILAEIELGHFISDIEKGAFCYESLAVVKEAIGSPSI